jgi:hypothetical protein
MFWQEMVEKPFFKAYYIEIYTSTLSQTYIYLYTHMCVCACVCVCVCISK